MRQEESARRYMAAQFIDGSDVDEVARAANIKNKIP
jgi:hypothetical protein